MIFQFVNFSIIGDKSSVEVLRNVDIILLPRILFLLNYEIDEDNTIGNFFENETRSLSSDFRFVGRLKWEVGSGYGKPVVVFFFN